MIRINQDLEVIIQVLADIAPQLGGHDFARVGIVAMNSKVDGVPRVENSHFRPLRGGLAFVRLLLTEFRHPLR